MQLMRLEIRNYKSLREVTIEPGAVSVFVGPNAAGKTNLVEAIDFLGDVYRWGLEPAVSHKGGYENICYRHSRRSKAAIQLRAVIKGKASDLGQWKPKGTAAGAGVILDHSFEFRTSSRGIGAPFLVTREHFVVLETSDQGGDRKVIEINRAPDDLSVWIDDQHDLIFKPVSNTTIKDVLDAAFPSELLFLRSALALLYPGIGRFLYYVASLRVYQLSPRSERQPGVPTPNPDLDRFGANLAAVIAYLQKDHPQQYDLLIDCVKRVMPSLERIDTDFTHTKTLAIFLKEKGFPRPWAADDISDGYDPNDRPTYCDLRSSLRSRHHRGT